MRLRLSDKEDTEIYVLDHSCLQFVCINAVNSVTNALAQTDGRLTAVSEEVCERLNEAEGQVISQGERLTEAEGRLGACLEARTFREQH